MNKSIVTFLIFLLFACTTTVGTNDARIGFPKANYDFGALPYKKEARYSFQFTNPGKTPLVILDVQTSCGCTVPEWTKKPLNPGSSGEIEIKYDADFPGVFHKTIKVYYNGKDSPQELTIKGEVEYPDDSEAAKKDE